MKSLARVVACLFLATLAFALSSCGGEEKDPDRVSTIPWNRPEKWEGQGPLGGMNPNSN